MKTGMAALAVFLPLSVAEAGSYCRIICTNDLNGRVIVIDQTDQEVAYNGLSEADREMTSLCDAKQKSGVDPSAAAQVRIIEGDVRDFSIDAAHRYVEEYNKADIFVTTGDLNKWVFKSHDSYSFNSWSELNRLALKSKSFADVLKNDGIQLPPGDGKEAEFHFKADGAGGFYKTPDNDNGVMICLSPITLAK